MQDRNGNSFRDFADTLAAYREANGKVPQTFFIIDIFVAQALLHQSGLDISSLTTEHEHVLSNTMSGAHVAKGRRIPYMGNTPLGHRLNELLFQGEATIVPSERIQTLFESAHTGAFRIIQAGQKIFGDNAEGRGTFLGLLDNVLEYISSDTQTQLLCEQYRNEISTGFGARHTSDGYRMRKAAHLKWNLRQQWLALLESNMAYENNAFLVDFINIILPWEKQDTTLTGFLLPNLVK